MRQQGPVKLAPWWRSQAAPQVLTAQGWQGALQETLLHIAAAAAAVEAALGGVAQDVEGCVTADGRVWVVQTRPQV